MGSFLKLLVAMFSLLVAILCLAVTVIYLPFQFLFDTITGVDNEDF